MLLFHFVSLVIVSANSIRWMIPKREKGKLCLALLLPPAERWYAWQLFFFFLWLHVGGQELWRVMHAVGVRVIDFSHLRIKQISKLILIFCSYSFFFKLHYALLKTFSTVGRNRNLIHKVFLFWTTYWQLFLLEIRRKCADDSNTGSRYLALN